jgi:hypothetical protein
LKFHIETFVKQNDSFCHEKHFIVDGSTISEKHPDYDVLAPDEFEAESSQTDFAKLY